MTLSGLLVVISMAVAVLSFITGVLVLIGTKEQKKMSAAFLFSFMLGTAIWSVSVSLYINGSDLVSRNILFWAMLIGSILALFSFVGYNLCNYKIGKFLLTSLSICSAVVMIMPAFDLHMVEGIMGETQYVWFAMIYGILLLCFIMISLFAAWHRYKNTTINKEYQSSVTVFTVGVFIVTIIAIVLNFVIPFLTGFLGLVWIAPLMSNIVPILFLYSSLKQHEMPMSSNYIVAISYVIFICVAALIQISLSVILDILLFDNDNNIKRLILIYSMITSISLLIIVKVFSYITEFLRSILLVKTVNLGFVLSRIYRYNMNSGMARLAVFLMEHLHVDYIGIIRNGKLYSSSKMEISDDEVRRIAGLNTPNDGIWQVVDLNTSYMLSSFGIKRIAELKDYSGNRLGQILVGKPVRKNNFDYSDLRSFGIVFSEIALILNNNKK